MQQQAIAASPARFATLEQTNARIVKDAQAVLRQARRCARRGQPTGNSWGSTEAEFAAPDQGRHTCVRSSKYHRDRSAEIPGSRAALVIGLDCLFDDRPVVLDEELDRPQFVVQAAGLHEVHVDGAAPRAVAGGVTKRAHRDGCRGQVAVEVDGSGEELGLPLLEAALGVDAPAMHGRDSSASPRRYQHRIPVNPSNEGWDGQQALPRLAV
jgi:hypothetical protein